MTKFPSSNSYRYNGGLQLLTILFFLYKLSIFIQTFQLQKILFDFYLTVAIHQKQSKLNMKELNYIDLKEGTKYS